MTDSIETQVETSEPPTPSVIERLAPPDLLAQDDPVALPPKLHDPIIERKAGPQLAKALETATPQKALKLAGKALSDSHKAEGYQRLTGLNMPIDTIDGIERHLDSGVEPNFRRDWDQPGNVNQDRILKRVLAENGQPLPPLKDHEPVLTSHAGKLHGLELNKRDGLRYAEEGKRGQDDYLRSLVIAAEQQTVNAVTPQAQPAQPQRPVQQAQPQQPVQAQRQQAPQQAQPSQAQPSKQAQFEHAVRQHHDGGMQKMAASRNWLDANYPDWRSWGELDRGTFIQWQQTDPEGAQVYAYGLQGAHQIHDAHNAWNNHSVQAQQQRTKAWSSQQDAEFNRRNPGFNEGMRQQTRPYLNSIGFSDPEITAMYDWDGTEAGQHRANQLGVHAGAMRDARAQQLINDAVSYRRLMADQTRAQKLREANLRHIDRHNTRPAPPAMKPGFPALGRGTVDHIAEVRKWEDKMRTASPRDQARLSVKLTQARRAAGLLAVG
jgi:hypothetical protein